MRLAIYRVVGEIVSRRERPHFGRTEVVGSATSIESPVGPQLVVVCCYVTSPAPFGTWNQLHILHELGFRVSRVSSGIPGYMFDMFKASLTSDQQLRYV